MRVVKILDHRFLKPSDTERLVPFKRESECVKFHTNPVLYFPMKSEEKIRIQVLVDVQLYEMSYNLSSVAI